MVLLALLYVGLKYNENIEIQYKTHNSIKLKFFKSKNNKQT